MLGDGVTFLIDLVNAVQRIAFFLKKNQILKNGITQTFSDFPEN